MEITNDYWVVRGETIEDAKKHLDKYSKEELIQLVINNRLNSFVSSWADKNEDEGGGKRIPYIGWYWRNTDFVNKNIPIGDCGEFIGVMENNKWDYPERNLTEEEVDKVLEIVWSAKKLSEEGGDLSEIQKNTKEKLEELWGLFQTFNI